MISKTLIACLAVCSVVQVLYGQEHGNAENFPPPEKAPEIWAVKSTDKIVIDGKLDEPAWNRVQATSNFFRMEPRQGGEYRFKTYVKIVYDDKNIYVGVYCRDSAGRKGLRVPDLKRDFSPSDYDRFGIQIDPQNLKRFCVSFQATPYGSQLDMQIFDDNVRDPDWDAPWKVRTQLTDSGYYAEFLLPFNILRYDRTDSVSWGLTFVRLARREYEITGFPAIPQAFSVYRMSYAAQLKGLSLPPPATNIRIQPYALSRFQGDTQPNNKRTTNSGLDLGGEIKWAFNTHAVLDLTLNTDFAQADVDRAVNNLTRFNVFFPERRQFFLENSGVFAGANFSGVKPFFSRTIGLASTQFNAEPLPIEAGLRYTDRTKDRTLAGLVVRQGGNAEQGRSNFGVLRYLKNFGVQNNIGVMLTHRHDEALAGKEETRRNNTTLTLDGFMRPRDDITLEYMISASHDDKEGLNGHAGSVYAGYFPNKWYVGWFSKWVSENYIPGMGFVFQNNSVHHNPGGYFIWRPKGKAFSWIRRFDPGLFVNYYHNANNGKFQQGDLYLFPLYLFTKRNAYIEGSITPTWQHIDFNFSILGRALEMKNYFYTRYALRYRSDQSRKFSYSGNYEWGKYYNGSLNALQTSLRFAPLPNLSAVLEYENNRFRNFGRLQEDFAGNLYTLGMRVAANPRIQLSAFYQYNDFDKKGRWNVRGSWEFMPLSFLYLVFNETLIRDNPVRNQSIIAKLTYLKQF